MHRGDTSRCPVRGPLCCARTAATLPPTLLDGTRIIRRHRPLTLVPLHTRKRVRVVDAPLDARLDALLRKGCLYRSCRLHGSAIVQHIGSVPFLVNSSNVNGLHSNASVFIYLFWYSIDNDEAPRTCCLIHFFDVGILLNKPRGSELPLTSWRKEYLFSLNAKIF